jgi:hypothetical protein
MIELCSKTRAGFGVASIDTGSKYTLSRTVGRTVKNFNNQDENTFFNYCFFIKDNKFEKTLIFKVFKTIFSWIG